jgi:hypothetical protein
VSYRDIEVKAPATWKYEYETIRPDCIIHPDDPNDPWAKGVPNAPYVTLATPNRPVPAIGCLHQPQPGDPAGAFGALPFVLWQPFVKLDEARPDLGDPEREDGQWRYRGGRLTRTTIDRVQITVLAPPDDPTLASTVVASVRRVQITTLGCQTRSPVQAARFTEPNGPPVPVAKDVAAVAICEYARTPGHAGLEGSRRISGPTARTLAAAILSAPAGGGPDRPHNCVSDMYGDHAIALRFFGSAAETTAPLAEAYVYYDWCFGNGIIDAEHRRQLTRADCAPLFSIPPIGFWGGSTRVYAACSNPHP